MISVVTLLIGLLAGLAIALRQHKQDQAFIILLLESQQADIPHDVAFRLKAISAAQAGDFAWIIRHNCIRVRARIPYIDQTRFEDPKRTEVVTLIERARSKVQELEQSSLCSIPR